MKASTIYGALLAGAILAAPPIYARGMGGAGQGMGSMGMGLGMDNASMQDLSQWRDTAPAQGNRNRSTVQTQRNSQTRQSVSPAGTPMNGNSSGGEPREGSR